MTLAETVSRARSSEDDVRLRLDRIQEDLLATSRYLDAANFTRIHADDLERMFGAYDEGFFNKSIREALAGRELRFRLAPRMTRSGGATTRFRARATGEESWEIAIAISVLFDGFRESDRRITVCGRECGTRLEALQRIFEHELVHLSEQLCWGDSDCSAARFQEIASRIFLHQSHTHAMITRQERAAQSGVRQGSLVVFTFEGHRYTGRVNRITKRASVLVEDAEGMLYSDGRRYKTYYVPIGSLVPVA